MIRGLLKFIEGETRGLHEAAYLLGSFAILSTLLALIRDRLLASTFGASTLLDIYYAAFRVPDVLFVLIASMVSVFVLVPMLTRLEEKEDKEEGAAIIGDVLKVFSLVMLAASLVVWLFLSPLLGFLFPTIMQGIHAETLVQISHIILLQPFFLGVSGVFASVTQIRGRYMLYAVAPLLYNAGIIIGIVFLYDWLGLIGLGYGVVLGAIMHVGVQVPFVLRSGYVRYAARLSINWGRLWRIVQISIPRTLSLSSNHIALLVLISFAGTVGAGAISVFSLAFNLQAVPLAVIGASYSVAAFPILSRYYASGRFDAFMGQIVAAASHIIFWSLPLLSLFVVLRAQIVRVVFGSGAFDWSDTRLTAAALALFIVSFTAQALSLLMVRGYYAAGKTWKPLVVNALSALGIVGVAYWLLALYAHSDVWRFFIEELLRVEGIAGTEVLMLPLAYASIAIINAIVFGVMFRFDFGPFGERIGRVLFESFSAAVVSGFVARHVLGVMDGLVDINTFWGIFTQGAVAGIAAIVAGVMVLIILGSQELKEVRATLHHKFWRFVPSVLGGTERDSSL